MVELIHEITAQSEVDHGFLRWKSSEAEVYKGFLPEEPFTIVFLGEEREDREPDWERNRLPVTPSATEGLEKGDRLKLLKRNDKVIVEKAVSAYTFPSE